jgi:hypothetical protein
MAITTLDGALAGMKYPREIVKAVTGTMVAGRPHTIWYQGGIPSAGHASSAGLVGEILVAGEAGEIPFTNPVSGNSYLARLAGQATQSGTLMLIDKIWVNSGITITSTSEQVFTSSLQIPARDANGTTDGDGVYAAVEVSTATGAGVPTLTIKYTNEEGVADHTATNVVATVASSIAGTFYPIGLQAGDAGIRKAQSIQLSATWTSGVIHVVLYRILARLELTIGNVPNAIDALTSGFPRIYDNSVLTCVFIPNTTTSSNITGHLIYSQG